ncbi:iron uptake system protein EfeO [Gandjariella thermophila]|uniref:Lipoprotein n=1 Tax=Gandjariella thermophila TaxID=1931992 RepID=A0A4D4J5M0_9PSEU|nr:iron uptake system protein EfeO [Gandjariella thermophila]GDY29889.1 lipoprotein [Gandjariella thermophila]
MSAPSSALRAAVVAAIGVGSLAGLSACGGKEASTAGAGAITVEASDDACKLSATSAPAGNVTFDVTNKGTKVTEFYLYGQADKVIGEVENIGPGLSRKLTVQVPAAGKYTTACKPGMTGDGIRGDFTVTGGAGGANQSNQRLDQAVQSYRQYLVAQTGALVQQTSGFVAAVKAGNAEQAKVLYAPARQPYERIEPVAEKFEDLDGAIDARESDVKQGEQFSGFHRLEKDLWTTGLRPDSGAVADKLLADVQELDRQVKTFDLTPVDLPNGAKELLDEVATKKVTGEEETFSHTDLWDFRANVDGSKAALDPLRAVVRERDAALLSTVDERFAAVDKLLDQYKVGDGYRGYTELSQDQVKQLSSAVDALSEPLSKVSGVVAQP